MFKKCKGCYQVKELVHYTRYCRKCINEREARRYLENKLKNEPWRYVECNSCPEIWRLEKKKLINGKMQGYHYEEYKRTKCPKCGDYAFKFKNSGKCNTQKVKNESKM